MPAPDIRQSTNPTAVLMPHRWIEIRALNKLLADRDALLAALKAMLHEAADWPDDEAQVSRGTLDKARAAIRAAGEK